MKIKSEELKKCLGYLKSIKTRKNVMEATKYVYISCSNSEVTMIYYDGSREASISCEIESSEDEIICVDFDKLNQKVDISPDGISIKLVEKDGSAILSIGKSRNKIGLFDPQSYPRFIVDVNGVTVKCKSIELTTAISKVRNFTPSNDSRPALNGINFDIKDAKLTIIGTDGQRLGICNVDCEYEDKANFNTIMPKESAQAFTSMMHEEDVNIFFTNSKIMASSGSRILMIPVVDAKYANWRSVFDMCKTVNSADYSASDLKYAIRSAMITSNHVLGGIEIEIKEGVTNFMSQDETGSTFEPIESNSNFEYRFAIGGTFLSQAISNIDGGVVSIHITDSDANKLRPIKLVEGNYTAIISPIRM